MVLVGGVGPGSLLGVLLLALALTVLLFWEKEKKRYYSKQ